MSATTLQTQEEIKKACLDGKFKIAILVCVSTDNNNKYYNMYQISSSEYLVVRGRVDSTEIVEGPYSMSKWDATYNDKTKESKKPKPYTDQTKLFEDTTSTVTAKSGVKKGGTFHSKRHTTVIEFVKSLQHHANESVKENYTVSAANVTKKQVDTAQSKLDEISLLIHIDSDVKKINENLLELYQIIPRKMKQVNDHLIKGNLISNKSELEFARDMIGREQDTLDVMTGQVQVAVTENAAPESTTGKEFDLLHSMNLEMEPVDAAEIAMIKRMLDQNGSRNSGLFVRAFKVRNESTEKKYDRWMTKIDDKKKELLWHGSRNENWWSIFQQGLVLRPTNAVITGKMFGYGIYFADKAAKSINYSSYSGAGRSYTGGRSSKAILAVYEVHQGKQFVIKNWKNEHSQLTESKMNKMGFDSVFAKGGADLVNNEFIVYNDSQCTIKYLVEIGN